MVLVAAACAATALTGAALGGSGASDERLPDLSAVPPYDLRVAGDAERFVLGFGSTSENVGVANLKMRGKRGSAAAQTMSAEQLVELTDGSERVYPNAGVFVYVTEETHRHWHWLEFMRYELRRASDLKLIAPDAKSGFCVADRERVEGYQTERDFPDPSWCEQDNPDATSLVVGMSVGWGDPYEALIEGQEIDVTGVAAGTYYLVHKVNPRRLLRESDYSNNLSAALISLSWPKGRSAAPRVKTVASCSETGTNRRDRLVGGGAPGVLCGLRGNDEFWLLGNSAVSALGGPGNDTFVSRFSGAQLDGGSGSDTADYRYASVEVTTDLRRGRVESSLGSDRLRGIENFMGGTLGDSIRGDRKSNVLVGGPGDDLLSGRGGRDVLRGGPGKDVLVGGRGRDRIFGGADDDSISSRDGTRDIVRCGGGIDTVSADRFDKVASDCESVRRA